MKKIVLTSTLSILSMLVFSGTGKRQGSGKNMPIPPAINGQASMQDGLLGFLENKGQISDTEGKPVTYVLFKAEVPGMDVYITEKGLTYVLIKADEENDEKEGEEDKDNAGFFISDEQEEKISCYRMDMALKGATILKENISVEGELTGYRNYYLSHLPAGQAGGPDSPSRSTLAERGGILNVRSYRQIRIKNVYPGIDWLIYFNREQVLKYDFIIQPSADASRIKLEYAGAEEINLAQEKDYIRIKTPFGILQEGALVAYEEKNRKKVNSFYSVKGSEVSFNVDTYDRGQVLVIDPPLVLLWATFIGSTGHDGPKSLTTDNAGNLYMVGYSGSFPIQNMVGAYSYSGFLKETFISKFSPTGVYLWGTYHSGIKNLGVAATSAGDLYVMGWTNGLSTQNLPGAYNQPNLGGWQDIYILKFNNAGARVWATFFGGGDSEMPIDNLGISLGGIALDMIGNLYVTGSTKSTDFPLLNLAGAYNQSNNGGLADAFVIKFDPAGALLWSTYYGGSGDDCGYSIATDPTGNIFVTGSTHSTNLPVQNFPGSYYQPNYGGGTASPMAGDAFIVKFDALGTMQWSTYYGGNGDEYVSDITADINGNVYVTGSSRSANFPMQNLAGAYNQVKAAFAQAFILKFNNSGAHLWATFYGGSSNENATAVTTDASANVYVVGYSSSNNFPLQNPGCGYYQPFTSGGGPFILKFNSSCVRQWATFYGNNSGWTNAVTIGPTGCLYVTGEFQSTPGVTTVNPGGGAYYQPASLGGDEGFIVQFCPPSLTLTGTTTPSACNCTGTAAVAVAGGCSPYQYAWYNSGSTLIANTPTVSNLCPGNYHVIVQDPLSGLTDTVFVTVTGSSGSLTLTSIQNNSTCNLPCNGSATVTPSGGVSPYAYVWNNGQTTQTATALCAGIYTVTVTDSTGCVSTQMVTILQPTAISVSITSADATCNKDGSATATVSGGTPGYIYSWDPATAGQTTPTASGLVPGTYTVTITDANGCTQTQMASITLIPGPIASASANPNTIAMGASTALTAGGGGTYQWSPPTGLSCITCINPTAAPSQTTVYCVVVTDSNGCKDSTYITINVETPCGTLFIPNAFSPNNDSENDQECVYGDCIELFHIRMYDRWGEKVFETHDPKTCWDGKYNGELLNSAVFTYYLDASLTTGETITKKGNVSLIR